MSRVASPAISFVFAIGIALSFGACGGPTLVDCDKLATTQDACMDDASLQACKDANDECAATADGEVLVLESCPLQFSCSTPRGNGSVPD